MGWLVVALAALPVLVLGLVRRQQKSSWLAEGDRRIAARAREVALRLGWSAPQLEPRSAVRTLHGEVDGTHASLDLGWAAWGDWANIELRGRRWLPEGAELRGPQGSGPDPLERERPNLTTDAGVGLVAHPIERFTSPSSLWSALARAIDTSRLHMTSEVYREHASVAGTDEVVRFVQAAAKRAGAWASATASSEVGSSPVD